MKQSEIYINGKSTKDMELLLIDREIGLPLVQTYKINVPGRNGELDLSEFLTGDVQYSNRTLKFKFYIKGKREKLISSIEEMLLIHGQKVEIVLDDYLNFYFTGRAEIACNDYKYYVEFELSVDAEPFRMAKEKQQAVFQVNSTAGISINNPGVPVIPTVTVSDSVTIIRNEKRLSLSKGKYYENELKLFNGSNDFSVEGNAEVIFEYREAFI